MRQPTSAVLSTNVNIASNNSSNSINTMLPGIHSLPRPIAPLLSFRQNLPRPPALPEVEFDSSTVTSAQWSPILSYRHPNLQRVLVVDDNVNIQATLLADSVTNETVSPTPATNPLPPQLHIDADLAKKFTHAIATRIATLRLLLLDVDGTPVVPLDYLQTQFGATAGTTASVMHKDHAGESASLILRRLIAAAAKRRTTASQLPEGNPFLQDDNGGCDVEETNMDVSEFLPVAGMRSLWQWGGQRRRVISFGTNDDVLVDASEIGADIQRQQIFSETVSECQCEPCIIESTLNAPFAYLLRTVAGYNGDPVKIAFHDAFCGSEEMKKKDYWRPEMRRMSVWENRFREFAQVHRVHADGIGHENCGSGHRHEVWCGYTGYTRRWPRSIEEDWSDVGGDHDEDSNSDGSSDESNLDPRRFAANESDGEAEDDDEDDNDDEDDEDGDEEDEDEEHEEIDDETHEKIFLENFMAKLQELFGLLGIYETLQQTPVVSR
ncbi:hypothetical protein HK100_009941 [Physocladia obscura]|uniref:Uncharacterized protein n=1 Tax=Physocladia obscura TaxID=109957 RepID=A0AAD5T9S5_9FUNG|nr:hypothetical protein HK100_009941 [Physocladia obscura]